MNRHLKSIIAASALSVWIALPSCAPKIDSDTYLQEEVSQVQQRTLPPGSRLVNQHPLTLQELGAYASWELDSNYAPDAYIRWLTSGLRPDFQVCATANSRLQFSKYVHGDEETLSLETASYSGTLRVAVKLEIYPD
jgi:hypothetical protein